MLKDKCGTEPKKVKAGRLGLCTLAVVMGMVVPDEGQDTAETEDIIKQAEVSACRETVPSVIIRF